LINRKICPEILDINGGIKTLYVFAYFFGAAAIKNYVMLQDSKVLVLPFTETLRIYKGSVDQKAGFDNDVCKWILNSSHMASMLFSIIKLFACRENVTIMAHHSTIEIPIMTYNDLVIS
jgi:hypothetical protein